MNDEISRREALRRIALTSATLALPGGLLSCAGAPLRTKGGVTPTGPKPTDFEKLSPVDRYAGVSKEFSGDSGVDRAHQYLWSRGSWTGRKAIVAPDVAKVCIVGGGMSGILSAYLLRDLKPVLLDQASRFGGNSRGESWEGVEHSIGAAYFSNPEKGTPLHELYSKAGIFAGCRARGREEPVLLQQRLFVDFWQGSSDPAAKKQFVRVHDFFLQRLKGKAPLPSVPAETDEDLRLLSELDRYDFLSYLVKQLGEPLHPHVHTLLELYCWSTFGASMQEVSAGIALNYYVAEFGDILVAPAGNASIAEKFLRHVWNDVPAGNFRPGSVALDVRRAGDLVHVTYIDHVGVLRVQKAESVVMACPKFVAKRLIEGLEKDRPEALSQLEYRAYVVGNACLDRGPARDLHDIYVLNEGEMPFGGTRRNAHNHGTPDITFANYAQVIKDRTVLTVYYPLPFAEGRAELLIPDAWDVYSARIKKDLFEKILPVIGYQNTDLKDLRLARWGHAMPLAKPGFYWSGAPKALSRPFGERIFFVHQDNWAAPAIETCAFEAMKWAKALKAAI